jgi:hypothetical protein
MCVAGSRHSHSARVLEQGLLKERVNQIKATSFRAHYKSKGFVGLYVPSSSVDKVFS